MQQNRKKISQEPKVIRIENLKLDLENPRLPKSKQNKDEKTVIEFMLLETATLELMMSIGENDYFAGEPLLVVKDKDDPIKYIVVEGNRRLTALKILNDPSIASVKKESIKTICSEVDYKPDEVPCLVFEEKEHILNYLGFRHITGIKSWRLLEKARYLFDLKEREFDGVDFSIACKNIAKMIGSRSTSIKKLITAYGLYKIVEDEGFYGIEHLNDTRFHLNYFVDAVLKENIRKFLHVDFHKDMVDQKINLNNLKTVTHWWFKKTEGKSRAIGNSRDLKMLDAIVGNPEALRAFKDEGATLDDAYDLTDDIESLFRNEIKKALKSLRNADAYSNKLNEFYFEILDDLRHIRETATKIEIYKFQKETMKTHYEFQGKS